MKTRKQIIKEILAKNEKQGLKDQRATLEYALQTMQDAILFSLAQDLDISLEQMEVLS